MNNESPTTYTFAGNEMNLLVVAYSVSCYE